MSRLPGPASLSRLAVRRPGYTIAAWMFIAVVGLAAATTIGSVLTTEERSTIETEASRGEDLLAERLWGSFPGRETVVVQSATDTVDSPAYEAFVRRLTREIRSLTEDVASVTNYYESGLQIPVSQDGRTTLLPVTLVGTDSEASGHVDALLALLAKHDEETPFTVLTMGDGSIPAAFIEQAGSDLETSEIVGVPVAIVILLAVFGTLIAAGLPLALALVSIVVALGGAALIGRTYELSVFVVNFVTTMGLAVGIDYALLITRRVREEREAGRDRDEAIVTAGATAGRAVLFSGMTVIVALVGLTLVPFNIFQSMAVGAIVVVAVTVLAALTLLPALLRLFGDRLGTGRVRVPGLAFGVPSMDGFWDSVTRAVLRRPALSALLAATVLLVAALPLLTLKLGSAGVSTLSSAHVPRRAFDILDEEFSAGLASPARVIVLAPDVNSLQVQTAASRFLAATAADGRFGPGGVETDADGSLLLISLPVAGDAWSDAARGAIGDLRTVYVPRWLDPVSDDVLVAGVTAAGLDQNDLLKRHTGVVFATVLGLSFVILLVLFRSIVVPIKAIAMNLLSVGAAYGAITLVFLHGVGSELLGFRRSETVELWIPLFLFAVVFGLSMDYHVFLLSRIRERFDLTGDNDEAIAFGLRSTAGMITGAAAIMVAVFAGVAAGSTVAMQQLGFGLAVAVFLDATIVRVVLVPATMKLLGNANWYLPSWLSWLPDVELEGRGSHQQVVHA